MGYYDGMGLDTAKASSYDVAAALQIPVVLVVSARGSRSVSGCSGERVSGI